MLDSETLPTPSCHLLPWRYPRLGSLMLLCTQLLLCLAPGYLECDGINTPFPTSHLWTTLNWISLISYYVPKFATNSSNLFSFLNCVCVCVCTRMCTHACTRGYRSAPPNTHIHTTLLVSLWRTNQLKLLISLNQKGGDNFLETNHCISIFKSQF